MIQAAKAHSERVARLQGELKHRHLAGFIVPRGDAHQGEYVASCSERLAWLTGFTGSAGTAIILRDRAALFVDGRYTAQASTEVDVALFEIRHVTDEPPGDWIEAHLHPRGRIGYDPWLHTPAQLDRYREACKKAGGTLVAVADNPIDMLWSDRPPPPMAPVVAHDERFAGESSAAKRRRVAETLRKDRQDAAVLSAPDSICWLLNIRGGDVPHAPLVLAFAILRSDGSVTLFVDPGKPGPGLGEWLGPDVSVAPPGRLGAALDEAGAANAIVRVDREGTPKWIVERLKKAGAAIAHGTDPCELPKAIKSDAELRGIRAAHVRDGASLTRFLAWLSREAPNGTVTELSAVDRLAAFREQNEHYRGPSFATISGSGGNGAIVHYRVTPATDRPLEPGSLYLVDSGGQYLDGTTDVTRTVAIGQPSDEMRTRFTLVLKGHIALATARFPKGTTGSQLDVTGAVGAVARRPGLRSRNRSRGRLLSQRPRRAAAYIQGTESRRAVAGDGRFQRARILQEERIRNPRREPGGGHQDRHAGRGGEGVLRFRNPDPRAHRPQSGGSGSSIRGGAWLARRLPRPGARNADAAG